MALSPPANTDVATRQDIDVLRTEMRGEFKAVRAETAAAIERATNRSLRWMVGVMVVLHGATVGLLTLTLG
jgi:hypothetical protein